MPEREQFIPNSDPGEHEEEGVQLPDRFSPVRGHIREHLESNLPSYITEPPSGSNESKKKTGQGKWRSASAQISPDIFEAADETKE